MNPRELWVYRHAESEANAGGRTVDFAAIPLTPRGEQQAQALADGLSISPAQIVVSPFLRSVQTAAPVAERFVEAPVETWRIEEFSCLDAAFCMNTTWVERKPRLDAYWARLDPDYVDGVGAESFTGMMARVRAFLRRATASADPVSVAISHGQFMMAALLVLEAPDLSPRDLMAEFSARQTAAPFANCERLRLAIDAAAVRPIDRTPPPGVLP